MKKIEWEWRKKERAALRGQRVTLAQMMHIPAQTHCGALVHKMFTHLSLLMQDREQFDWQFDWISIIYFSDTVCAYTFPYFPVTQQGALDSVIIYTMGVCIYVCVCSYPQPPSVLYRPMIIYLPINCQSLCSLLTSLLSLSELQSYNIDCYRAKIHNKSLVSSARVHTLFLCVCTAVDSKAWVTFAALLGTSNATGECGCSPAHC